MGGAPEVATRRAGRGQSALDKIAQKRHDRNMEQARIAQEIDRGNPGDAGRAEAARRFRDKIATPEYTDYFAQMRAEAEALLAPPPPSRLSPLDAAIAQAQSAMERGDYDAADRLFAKAERIDAAEKAKEAAAKKQSGKILKLIDEGWNAAEAEAEVTGSNAESIRRRDFIAKARSEGHPGRGFDDLVASVHAEFAAEQYFRSEVETRGAGAIKPKYSARYRATDLWLVNDATARKIMTPEMAEWFDTNGGRVTRDVMKRAILSGSDVFDTTQRQDYLQ